MKRLVLAPTLMVASPALAHPGAHLHPHAVEGWLVGVGILACALGAGVVLRTWTRRK